MLESSLRRGSRWTPFRWLGLWLGALSVLAASFGACRGEDTAKPPKDKAAAAASPGTALGFYTVAPCRLLDTRVQGQGPALTAGTARQVIIATKCGIPVTAVSVAVNVTAFEATGDGSLNVYPNPTSQPPATSAVSFQHGTPRSNNAVLTLNTVQKDGTVQVMPNMPSGGTVHVVIDVSGYFAP